MPPDPAVRQVTVHRMRPTKACPAVARPPPTGATLLNEPFNSKPALRVFASHVPVTGTSMTYTLPAEASPAATVQVAVRFAGDVELPSV